MTCGTIRGHAAFVGRACMFMDFISTCSLLGHPSQQPSHHFHLGGRCVANDQLGAIKHHLDVENRERGTGWTRSPPPAPTTAIRSASAMGWQDLAQLRQGPVPPGQNPAASLECTVNPGNPIPSRRCRCFCWPSAALEPLLSKPGG